MMNLMTDGKPKSIKRYKKYGSTLIKPAMAICFIIGIIFLSIGIFYENESYQILGLLYNFTAFMIVFYLMWFKKRKKILKAKGLDLVMENGDYKLEEAE